MAHLRRLALNALPPNAITHPPAAIDALATFLATHRRVAVLTGAGLSTDSGIPDYRSPGRPPHQPLQHSQFVESSYNRQRYWARSLVGYPQIKSAEPNTGHLAIATANRHHLLGAVVTQNVDGLHDKAGSPSVVALHGDLRNVQCLDCHAHSCRDELQQRMLHLNHDLMHTYLDEGPRSLRPDGDVVLNEDVYRRFVTPGCSTCNGTLKPGVIFFGGTVPPEVAQASYDVIDQHDALLVVGTSLAVWSSFRLLRRALAEAKPIFVLNQGATRADEFADGIVRVNASIAQVLPAAVKQLLPADTVEA